MVCGCEPDDFVKDPERLIDLCRKVISQVESDFNDPKFAEKEAQLREIARAIERLEKTGVPVPDMLRAEKTRLAVQIGGKTEGNQILVYLAEEMGILVKELNGFLGKCNESRPETTTRAKRSRKPKTDMKTLRAQIINALKKYGGRARLSEMFSAMEKQFEGQFLPGDLDLRKDGKTVVWRNNVRWERMNMVRDGVLRNDSPRGIWELSEGIK